MNKQPPSNAVQKIVNARWQIKSAVTSLRHEEYGLSELLSVANEYDPKQYRLALTLHSYQLDDLIRTLAIVKEWLTEAADKCE